MSTIINATTTNGVVIQPDNSGSLQLATNSGTTALTIDTSQNVGIGTTSPAVRLDIIGTSSQNLRLRNGTVATEYYDIGRDGADGLLAFNGAQSSPYVGYKWSTTGTERMRIDSSGNLLFNSGFGSVATAFGCRAWVNFNGTGTVAIRGSGNVTSITDNGTGQYTLNFTNSMTDSNYSVVGSAGESNNAIGDRQLSTYPINTSSCKVVSGQTATTSVYDATQVHVAIFR